MLVPINYPGNQQKLLIGREMSRSINLLIASQPTRGVDVGSIEYIHNQIVFARNKGIGIILNSTELEEIIALSDRIIVFFEGKVIAEFPSDTDPNIIGLAMAGRKLKVKIFNYLGNYFSNRETFQEIIVIPVFATFLAIFLGLLLLIISGSSNEIALKALIALFYGSFGSLSSISETLTAATPLIFAALGIAVGFRAGLFNIGAEGQIILGGMAAVIIGFSFQLPFFIHLILILLVGALFGALYAFISGWLKATTGAHEVITTIMLNLIAYRLLDFFLRIPSIQKKEEMILFPSRF